tara:strand:+ start:270 stop:407 length:138 start_codon:yes stop_codon:yes gene_type:complete
MGGGDVSRGDVADVTFADVEDRYSMMAFLSDSHIRDSFTQTFTFF